MKVLHLSTFDVRGGAARGAFWLHRALRRQGVDSHMLVARKYGEDAAVHEPAGYLDLVSTRIRMRLDQLPLRGYSCNSESYWTVGWQSNRLDRMIEPFEPDLVHLHWIGGGFVGIEALRRLQLPVVWTMRDMWPFTGGCHYSGQCERYLSACGRCPQLNSCDPDDISDRLWRQKRKAWKELDLWLVPISTWLAGCAARSGMFDGRPVQVIPNGIDLHRFNCFDRGRAKDAWRLAPDRRHILFGAIAALDDMRKGFGAFRDCIRILARRGWDRNAEIVIFGDSAPTEMLDLDLPIRCVGQVNDDRALAQLYAAADVMVAPSLQEAFGKTLVEAMACGTPVVAFGHGGPLDIIDHRMNGYLAEAFQPQALADGIAWCCESDSRATELGRRGREKVERSFDIEVVAGQYRNLYRRMLGADT